MVAIIVPAFNAEKTLADTLNLSIKYQGECIKEVIIADDFSNNKTIEAVELLQSLRSELITALWLVFGNRILRFSGTYCYHRRFDKVESYFERTYRDGRIGIYHI